MFIEICIRCVYVDDIKIGTKFKSQNNIMGDVKSIENFVDTNILELIERTSRNKVNLSERKQWLVFNEFGQ